MPQGTSQCARTKGAAGRMRMMADSGMLRVFTVRLLWIKKVGWFAVFMQVASRLAGSLV